VTEKTEDAFLISLVLFSFAMGLLFAFLLLKVSSREFGRPKVGYDSNSKIERQLDGQDQTT
jgi:hypothetical protein